MERERREHLKDDFKGIDNMQRELHPEEQRVLQRKETLKK